MHNVCQDYNNSTVFATTDANRSAATSNTHVPCAFFNDNVLHFRRLQLELFYYYDNFFNTRDEDDLMVLLITFTHDKFFQTFIGKGAIQIFKIRVDKLELGLIIVLKTDLKVGKKIPKYSYNEENQMLLLALR
jgi:hypothetical protein